jgi:hypothetical protein
VLADWLLPRPGIKAPGTPVVAFTELSTSAVWLSPGRVEGRDIHVLTDVDLLDLIAGGGEQFRQVDFLV